MIYYRYKSDKEMSKLWKKWREKKIKKAKKKNKVKETPTGLFGLQYRVCNEFFINYKDKTIDEKIARLKALSELKFKNKRPYEERRKRSHRVSNKDLCWICNRKAEVQHHILQIQYGGYDNGINRIKICTKCHEQIHNWLLDRRYAGLNKELDKEFTNIVSSIK